MIAATNSPRRIYCPLRYLRNALFAANGKNESIYGGGRGSTSTSSSRRLSVMDIFCLLVSVQKVLYHISSVRIEEFCRTSRSLSNVAVNETCFLLILGDSCCFVSKSLSLGNLQLIMVVKQYHGSVGELIDCQWYSNILSGIKKGHDSLH